MEGRTFGSIQVYMDAEASEDGIALLGVFFRQAV